MAKSGSRIASTCCFCSHSLLGGNMRPNCPGLFGRPLLNRLLIHKLLDVCSVKVTNGNIERRPLPVSLHTRGGGRTILPSPLHLTCRPCRFARDEFVRQKYVARLWAGAPAYAVQQQVCGNSTDLGLIPTLDTDRRRVQLGEFRVPCSDDGEIVRDSKAADSNCLQH